MKRTHQALLYVALPVAVIATALALRGGDGAREDGALALAAGNGTAATPSTAETSPPEDLLPLPLRPEAALEADVSGAGDGLEATPSDTRREIAQPESGALEPDLPFVITEENGALIRILGERLSTQNLIIDSPQAFRIYASGELKFSPLVIQHLSEGLNATEHAPGVPASQGYVKGGLKTGLWTTWHASGNKESEGRYTYGQMHGPWTTWHDPVGHHIPPKASEGEYLYGKREGPWIEHHSNGKRRETATYTNGQRDGRVTTWHAGGARKSEAFYSYGRQHLEFRDWHADGQQSRRGTFEYGQLVGRLRVWNPDGTLDEEQSGVYENGQRVRD